VSAQPLAREAREKGTLRRWIGILSAYFTAQTLTQLLGIAAGLLFVNLMPVREFALYALASSVITFFTFASDLGSTGSLVYFFNQAAREGGGYPSYFAAVLSLRRAAFFLGAAAVCLALPWVAARRGFGGWEVALALGGVLLAVWFQIDASLGLLALRLDGRQGASYRAELAGSGTRLAGAGLLAAVARLEGWLGVLSAALGPVVTARLARPGRPREETAADLRPHRRAVLRYLLPTLPGALYFSVRGPLLVWLAAAFGSTRSLAEVGALGRLGLVVGLFSGLTGIVFLPRLAHIADDRLYRARFLQFGGFLLLLAAGMLAAAAAAPGLFLFLLGESYAGLRAELLLVVAGAGLSLLDGYAVSVNLARAWTRWQGLAVASLAVTQALLIVLLPLSTARGVLWFNLLSAAAALAGQAAIAALGFLRPRWVRWA
jgi:O-antigen/teichoic acid export membrane protein